MRENDKRQNDTNLADSMRLAAVEKAVLSAESHRNTLALRLDQIERVRDEERSDRRELYALIREQSTQLGVVSAQVGTLGAKIDAYLDNQKQGH